MTLLLLTTIAWLTQGRSQKVDQDTRFSAPEGCGRVGFAICTTRVRKLESLPRGVNDRLVVTRIPLLGKTHLTLNNAYAPTLPFSQEQNELVYQDVYNTVRSVPGDNSLLLLVI